ncbi:hypothetical protein BpHYR1_017601 [Brachionus plicatilis]|uniref:Uncharacterized protein n=1 Tax=Brachionus plicatilis TaxID=10195 RepID=A0A3M7T974_BRAPC|nr:hypothetical protein BpHYR1_017601 [Brachionus plicatilis]
MSKTCSFCMKIHNAVLSRVTFLLYFINVVLKGKFIVQNYTQEFNCIVLNAKKKITFFHSLTLNTYGFNSFAITGTAISSFGLSFGSWCKEGTVSFTPNN